MWNEPAKDLMLMTTLSIHFSFSCAWKIFHLVSDPRSRGVEVGADRIDG